MPKYKVLLPIGWSGRHEASEIVEMPEETAKAFGPEYLASVDEVEAEEEAETEVEAEEEVKDELDDLEREELKDLIKTEGLDVKITNLTDVEIREAIRKARK
ncbi:MAG: hypothetical protein ACOYUZ_01615 [Patescibacteria group bacterium]